MNSRLVSNALLKIARAERSGEDFHAGFHRVVSQAGKGAVGGGLGLGTLGALVGTAAFPVLGTIAGGAVGAGAGALAGGLYSGAGQGIREAAKIPEGDPKHPHSNAALSGGLGGLAVGGAFGTLNGLAAPVTDNPVSSALLSGLSGALTGGVIGTGAGALGSYAIDKYKNRKKHS